MKNRRYFIAHKEEAGTPYRSMTSTLNEKGQVVVFDRSHCERMFDGYLEPILSLPTKKEAMERVKKAKAGDWIILTMKLTDEGVDGLMRYFEWLEDEWGGVLNAIDTSITVSP